MDTKKICKETVTFIFRVTTSCLHPQVSSNQHRCLMGDGCIKIKACTLGLKVFYLWPQYAECMWHPMNLCLTIVFCESDSNNKEQFQRLESDMLSSRGQREDDSTQHTVLKKSGAKKIMRTPPFPQPSCWPAIEWRGGTNARLRRGKKKTLREHIMQSDSFWEPHPTSVRLPDTHNTNPICHSLISFFFLSDVGLDPASSVPYSLLCCVTTGGFRSCPLDHLSLRELMTGEKRGIFSL